MEQSDDLDLIIPNVYLGSLYAAKSDTTLQERGITHILTMGYNMEPTFPDKFTYKVSHSLINIHIGL